MDLTIPISGGALGTALLVWAGKQIYMTVKRKFETFDAHVISCTEKAVKHAETHARLETQVSNLDEKVSELKSDVGRVNQKLDTLLLRS